MNVVLESVKVLFLLDHDEHCLLPTEHEVGGSSGKPTLQELATMSGKDRRAALVDAGFLEKHIAHGLRAIQHLTAIRGFDGSPTAGYPLHPMVPPACWAPDYRITLLGFAYSNSAEVSPTRPRPRLSDAGKASDDSESLGFAGLLNQGSTCYLNSLLQTLYFLSDFRRSMYEMPVEDDQAASRNTIPLALQKLFCRLQLVADVADTKELTASFGWDTADAFVQHDIHELTQILLDNLEAKLKKSGSENTVKRLFCGRIDNYIAVKEVDYRVSHEEDFYDIQLVVQGTNSIYESFDRFVVPDVLEGSNKYCLDRDGVKSYHVAEKGQRFVTFPPVIILHLTRFDFDPMTAEMRKVLQRWEYYDQLDLSRYCPHTPREMNEYQLQSVLVHSGADARFGHYFCYVRTPVGWVKFNDEHVSKASPRDVFEKNFGGSTTNYWGSEVPVTTNAYVLMYTRKTMTDTLLEQVPAESVPRHLRQLVQQEQQQKALEEMERANEHLYARFFVFSSANARATPELLTSVNPQVDVSKTLRLRRADKAAEHLHPFVEDSLGIPRARQRLWFLKRDPRSSCSVVFVRLTASTEVHEIAGRSGGGSNVWGILATDDEGQLIEGTAVSPLHLTHHKFYNPFMLTETYVTSLVVGSDADIAAVAKQVVAIVAKQMKDAETGCLRAVKRGDVDDADSSASADDLSPADGATYVWFEELPEEERALLPFPTVDSFGAFPMHSVHVELHHMQHPEYPLAHRCTLADNMTYEQVQRYVARVLSLEDFDKVRFSRHNPETKCPFFMKIKKKDKSTLRTLLTACNMMSTMLYFEECQFSVTELESQNPLQFEFFDERVKPTEAKWLLFPQPPLEASVLLKRCAEEPGVDDGGDGSGLRLLDIWKGKIYNTYDASSTLTTPFEESAQYRLERIPPRLADVPEDDQYLLTVHHFAKTNGGSKLQTHGDPFSLFVTVNDDYNAVVGRIAQKLETTVQSIAEWKPCVLRGNETFDLSPDEKVVSAVQRIPRAGRETATLGLEHAPLPSASRTTRYEGRSLKIYN